MHRLVIALLAALDAVITAAVGLGIIVAPLALFWATTGGGWGSLWPTSGTIWQAGHFVPLHIDVPEVLARTLGVAPDAAAFVFSLAPLAFAVFAISSAARSGVRANLAGSWIGGVIGGTVMFTAIAALVAFTTPNAIAAVVRWQAILFPALVYAIPLLIGALVSAWSDGDRGVIDRVHDRFDELPDAWNEVPALVARGIAVTAAFFVAFGAIAVLVSLITRGGEMIALFQSNRVDLWGAILLTLVHLAYLPTAIVWGASWVAGPGFSVGSGSAITPVASESGIVPAVPLFALLPEGGSVWMLAVILLPLAGAVVTGWMLRSRYVAVIGDREPFAPRLVTALGVGAGAAGVAAAAALAASGAMGPGRLAGVGPHPGWMALAVGTEVLIGVAVMLLSPRGDRRGAWTRAFDESVDDVESESERTPR